MVPARIAGEETEVADGFVLQLEKRQVAARADRELVPDPGVRLVHDPVTGTPGAHGPVRVLGVDEEGFIQLADACDQFARHKHTTAGCIARFGRGVILPVVRLAYPSVTHGAGPERYFSACIPEQVRWIVVVDFRNDHAAPFLTADPGQQCRQEVRVDNRVIVEQEEQSRHRQQRPSGFPHCFLPQTAGSR